MVSKNPHKLGAVASRRLGATVSELSGITGLSTSNISRRHDVATSRKLPQPELYDPVARIIETLEKMKS